MPILYYRIIYEVWDLRYIGIGWGIKRPNFESTYACSKGKRLKVSGLIN